MNIKTLTVESSDYPERLRKIDSPPNPLYHVGAPLAELLKRPAVAIVGTRKMSLYGQQTTQEFAAELAGQGLVIISGLALGLDAQAHRSALEHGGLCIAVLPCPLQWIIPKTNRRLAQQILDSGGALVSEYPEGEWPKPQHFIARNRIVSGLADVVLIPEAGHKSGALYTANFAVNQNRDVLVVPGNIYAPGSGGVHNLLKQGQAGAATIPKDVLNALGLRHRNTKPKDIKGRNANEQAVLDPMVEGITEGDHLLEKSGLGVSLFNQTLTMLEIRGLVKPLGANHWSIV
jgi:DNA processing protein